ncbi:G5 domain-containing protein [Actinoplanes bogorensis]|uniref:G5 domain-containing protein n=1 Tax=Paractinoplanes bogorensis TaxID=1610840 RepID=A0ABS5YJE3_9ACTN|nr:G5 domain-containing protein [Actinoplanes bogorensis]MBU2662839.1 G5 domain-containing protein [Actinoplanes bogorensis]
MPRKSWWARLPFGVRMTAGTSALLIAIGGVAVGVGMLTGDDPAAPRIVTAIGQAGGAPPVDPQASYETRPPGSMGLGADSAGSVPVPAGAVAGAAGPAHRAAGTTTPAGTTPRTSDKADRTGTRAPRPPAKASQAGSPGRPGSEAPTAAIPPGPQVTTRTDVETREVPFQTRFVRDPSLPRGTRKVQAEGVAGEETLRYLVTLTDGQETSRKLMDIVVTRQPQHRVIAFGGRRGFDGRCDDKGLDLCVPLGRQACSPESGSINVLDQDVQLLNGGSVGELPQMNCGRR